MNIITCLQAVERVDMIHIAHSTIAWGIPNTGLMENNAMGTKSALDSGKDHKFLQHWVYK